MTSEKDVEISRLDLEASAPAEATITDVQHLASYNWIEATQPTIAVPGIPARWSPPEKPQKLQKDSGLVFIAQNAARHPASPLEPLFRSLYIEQPSFDINPIDVVTDRNNIRRLLLFIQPSLARRDLDSFTIQVEMAAQTAIFCRDETPIYQYIAVNEFKGFGREFEKAYTTYQIEESTGHYRILQYRLGGLRFLVRHETDGYLDEKPAESKDLVAEESIPTNLDSLSPLLETASVDEAVSQPRLTIKKEGWVVPRELTLEVKTRAFHKPLELSEFAAQLWISQTPNLVRAYHKGGLFSTPEVDDISTALQDWEQAHQEDIRKLVALITRILQVTREWGGTSTIQYDDSKDKLVAKKVTGRRMLPDDLYSLWTDVVPTDVEQNIPEKHLAVTEEKE
ncbi:geranylgeranyl pyrophosphate synthetase [Penicillium paradoxum]|uniref:geranylgeranyl pyrophosphate synthetase n=1 Tax=Penicillium paradoxum TaxID=176176 RepID=UPI002546763E|nr:geranylgeranyl pyrophosphate synthetase [Penicillium paradoxum]KAJ5780518.1 geranylgeranyl pyrophosphate synthetase [Penicillium paradoxum]